MSEIKCINLGYVCSNAEAASVEEVFRDAAAGLGDAVAVAVAQDLLHCRRPHRLPQARLVRGGGRPLMMLNRLDALARWTSLTCLIA